MVAKDLPTRPQLIAHRGYSAQFPGNTLLAYEHALTAGARFVELDVQLSRDLVPVLYHDVHTLRMSGIRGSLLELNQAQIKRLSAHYPKRFGSRYTGNRVPTLSEFCHFFADWPAATAFVELKRASLAAFGMRRVVEIVIPTLRPIEQNCVIISFDHRCVEYARKRFRMPIGWVVPRWDRRNEARARALAPEYLFVNQKRLPGRDSAIWRGPWQWAVYVVNDAVSARRIAARGIEFIETDEIVGLLDQL